jgi:transposase
MITVGLDVHRARTNVALLDETTGEMVGSRSVPTENVPEFVGALPVPARVVMEAGTTSMVLARTLKSCIDDVSVVNCTEARRQLTSMATAKNDRIDAENLAIAHSKGRLEYAFIWVPDQATAELRVLTRTRIRLVRQRVSCQVQLRNVLDQIDHPRVGGSMTSQATRRWLEELDLRPSEAAAVRPFVRLLDDLTEEIKLIEAHTRALSSDCEICALLMTLPGVADVLAPTIHAEIGTIERFPRASHLASYCGLPPVTEESGGRQSGRGMQDDGNRWLRWAFVEAAQHFACATATQELAPVKRFQRLAMRKHRNVAKVALANALTHIVFAMLRDRRPFDISML